MSGALCLGDCEKGATERVSSVGERAQEPDRERETRLGRPQLADKMA